MEEIRKSAATRKNIIPRAAGWVIQLGAMIGPGQRAGCRSTKSKQCKMVRIGITYKLFFSILGAACLALVSMFLMMQWNLHAGFLKYIRDVDQARLQRLTEKLSSAYAEHGGWDFLRQDPMRWIGPLSDPGFPDRPPPGWPERPPGGPGGPLIGPPLPPPHRPGWDMGPPPHYGARGPHLIVLDESRKPLFGGPPDKDVILKPIICNNRVVGYAGMRLPPKHFLDPMQLHFLRQQKSALAVAALGLIVAVSLFALLLSRRLLRPVKSLAAATQDLASGKYAIRVPVTSSDELGRLARSFNAMALTFEQNEKARRQWVADISHELRTPLSILLGEIEALLERVRETTPEAIRSLHAEALRLHRLVDDLYQLALSDLGSLTYRKEIIDPAEVLDDVLETYLEQFAGKDIEVSRCAPEYPGGTVFADWERLRQLFVNLFDNSLKYTEPGGSLAVLLFRRDDRMVFELEDSAPGVPEDQLERLFDRLYRVEGSRSRATGGAGLGLAICKNIVEAHGGTIAAYPSLLGGVLIIVSLPIAERQS